MSLPIEFAFDDKPVRVVLVDGEPWWVAADIAAALQYRETKDMTRILDDDEADRHNVPVRSANGVGQSREMTIINESVFTPLSCAAARPRPSASRSGSPLSCCPASANTAGT